MRLIKNATKLIGTKDPNIIISLVFETDTHIKIHAKLDYPDFKELLKFLIATGLVLKPRRTWQMVKKAFVTNSLVCN